MAQSQQPPGGSAAPPGVPPGRPTPPRPGQPAEGQQPGAQTQPGQQPPPGAGGPGQQIPPPRPPGQPQAAAGGPAPRVSGGPRDIQPAGAFGGPSGGGWEPPGTPRNVPPGISIQSGMGRFQTQVFYQPAVAVEGDFCDHNPRTTVNAGPGGLVAGEPGVMVGRFAWFDPDGSLDPNDAPRIVLSFTDNPQPVVGFVHREQQGLITHWLGGAGMWVPPGFMVTLHQTGGFFVRNSIDDRAELGMKAFARMEDGAIGFGATAGGPGSVGAGNLADFVETKWFATSAGDPGMLIKMSSWPLG